MKEDTADTPNLILQPYILEILKELRTPKRFTDLNSKIKSKQTLSVKLARLKKNGLIALTPMMVNGRYANAYIISDKGKKIIKILETIR